MPDAQRNFSQKEAPFLLGVAFAIVGWTLTHVVDRLNAEPYVTWKHAALSASDMSRLDPLKAGETYDMLQICNITEDHAFQQLEFVVSSNGDITDTFQKPGPNTQLSLGDSAQGSRFADQLDSDGKTKHWSAHFKIAQILPGQSYYLVYKGKWQGNPSISARSGVADPSGDSQVLHLVEASPLTWFAANELIVLLSLAGLFILITIWYLFQKAPSI